MCGNLEAAVWRAAGRGFEGFRLRERAFLGGLEKFCSKI